MQVKQMVTNGGMLSSADFLDLVIIDDVEGAKRNFWKREWVKTGNKLIIDPFDPKNLTPFSYDLCVGKQVYSCTRGTVRELSDAERTYWMAPRETVVIKTREFLALPPDYSATVWPRFSMVTEAVFQSMVKTDPTWYGELGVAVTNLSAGDYPIELGRPFATLILYELRTKAGMSLYLPQDLPRHSESEVLETNVRDAVVDRDFNGLCELAEGKLRMLRLPDADQYKSLLMANKDSSWRLAVNRCIGTFPRPMQSLGMNTLQQVKPTNPRVRCLSRDDISGVKCSESDLENAAIQHGRPFDLLTGIHELVVDTIDRDVAPRIRAEVEASLFPKTVSLTLSVIGFLSLIIATLAFLLDKYKINSALAGIDWPGTVAMALGSLGLVVLVTLIILITRRSPESRAIKNLKKEVAAMRTEVQKKKPS